MFKRMLNLSCVFLSLTLAGCGATQIEITVEGEGVVVSNLEGIECGSDRALCRYTFSPTVETLTLTATPYPNSKYVFSRWEGACSGITTECKVSKDATVTAIYVSSDELGNNPTKPSGFSVSAMSSQAFLLQWGAASDQVTPRSNLQYKIYVQNSTENIVDQSNLVATVFGSAESRYSYDLDMDALGLISEANEYTIAIIALDSDGFESVPIVLTNQSLSESDLKLADGINLIEASEAEFPVPMVSEDDSTVYYRFEGMDLNSVPNVNDYVAYPVRDSGVSYHELIKVIEVFTGGFSGEVVPLSEISAGPITLTGSGTLGRK